MANCRIQNLKTLCNYASEGIAKIWLLDLEDFQGFKFDDKKHIVKDVYRKGDFIEFEAPDTAAKYNSSEEYNHTLETFTTGLNGCKSINLHLGTKRRFVVFFLTKGGAYFAFGSDTGATLSYKNQTEEGSGALINIVASSRYPLFEIDPEALKRYVSDFTYDVDFSEHSYCELYEGKNTGVKRATIAYKISSEGDPLDIDNSPIRISGKKQAIALLKDKVNPDPDAYEVDFYFNERATVNGMPTEIVDFENCPISEFSIDKNEISLSENNTTEDVFVQSVFGWIFLDPKKLVTAKPSFNNMYQPEVVELKRTKIIDEGYVYFKERVTDRVLKLWVKNS